LDAKPFIGDLHENIYLYRQIQHPGIGAGLGAGKYCYLAIFRNRASLLKNREGVWKPTLGAEPRVYQDRNQIVERLFKDHRNGFAPLVTLEETFEKSILKLEKNFEI